MYSTHSGRLDTDARLWAAVLVCGDGATLSHETAAEMHGLIDRRAPSAMVHVTVPSGRNIHPPRGIGIHYSSRLDASRHPALKPPRTRIEDTVVDLTQSVKSLDRASALVADAVQRRLTTHDRIVANISGRPKLKWRAELLELCGVVASGAHTVIELRYVNGVERAHGLPRAERQVRIKGPAPALPSTTKRFAAGESVLRIVDNRYIGYGVIVELDGQRGHTGDGVFRDMWRDNMALIQGERTLRFGLDDVTFRKCETAAVVVTVLGLQPRPCSGGCPVLDIWQQLKAA